MNHKTQLSTFLAVACRAMVPLARAALIILGLTLAAGAQAQTTQYAKAGITWHNTTTGWSSTSGGPYTSTWTGGNDAVLQTTAGTVTGSGTVTVHNLTFTATPFLITGSTLTFVAPTPTITLANGQSETEDSIIAGTAGLTVAGGATGSTAGGTIQFSGVNTFTGGLTLSGNGRIVVLGGGNLGASSGTVTVGSGSGIYLSGASAANNYVISGTGYLGDSPVLGALRINTSQSVSGTVTLAANARIYANASGQTVSVTGVIGDNGNGFNLDCGGQSGAILSLTQANTYTGGTTISGGVLQLGIAQAIPGNTIAGDVTVSSGATLDMHAFSDSINGLNGAGTVKTAVAGAVTLTVGGKNDSGSFSGVIQNTTGTIALTKTGTGTQTLSGANTYTGATTISGGELVGVVGGSSSSAVTVNNTAGCTLGVSITDNTKQWTCTGVTLAGSSAVLDFNFGNSVAPSTTVAPLAVTGNVTISAGTPAITIEGNSGLFVAGTYPLMTWTGTGPAAASPSTVFSVTMPSRIVGHLTVVGKTLNLVVTGNTEPLTWNTGTGNWDINTTANWKDSSGATGQFYLENTLPGDAVVFDDTPGAGNYVVTVANPVTPVSVTVSNSTANYTLQTGVIAGGTGLTKSGAGTLTVSSANTYSGGTTVNAGTLALSGSGTLGAAADALTITNGTLDLGGLTTPTAGTVTISGGTIQNGTLTASTAYTANDTGAAAVSATLAGSVALTQSGAGTLTISGANSYSGGTIISAGTLALSGSGTLGEAANALTVTSTGTLDLGGLTTPTAGTVTIAGGTIQNGTLTASTAYTANDTGAATVSATLAGSAIALTKSGGGTLTLNGANTYTGANTITGGAIVANNATALGSGPVTITTSQLTLGTSLSIGNLTGGAATSLIDLGGAGTNLTVNEAGSTIFAGILSDAGSLTVSGGGSLTLSGANTFTGGTTLSGNSRIVTTVASALGASSSPVIVGSGSQVDVNAASPSAYNYTISGTGYNGDGFGAIRIYSGFTVPGNITLSGNARISANTAATATVSAAISGGPTDSLDASGNTGTLVLSGVNTSYGGGTTISQGSVKLTNLGALPASGPVNVATAAQLQIGVFGTLNTFPLALNGNGTAVNLYLNAGNTSTATLPGAITLTNGAIINSYGINQTLALNGGIGGDATTDGLVFEGSGINNARVNYTLGAAATYAGNTTIKAVTAAISVISEVANALPTTTSLTLVGDTSAGGFGYAQLDLAGNNQTLAGLSSVSSVGGTAVISSSGTPTLTVTNAGANSFAGVIGGGISLIKGGAGTLTFSNANTYTGNTTISAGTLALGGGGSIASTPTITIATNATWDVSGVTGGSFALNGSGTLAFNIDKTGGNLTQGQLALGAKNLTYGGALTVAVTGDALTNGDSFTLFATNGAAPSGWFSSVSLPTLASGLSWDTNNLATSGVLDVYNFSTTALTLSTPTNTPATITAAKLANHVSSMLGMPVAVAVSMPTNGGTASVDGSGNLTYTPVGAANVNGGTDGFTVTFADGHGTQTMAVSVTVGSGNSVGANATFVGQIGSDFVVTFAGIPGYTYTVETNSVVAGAGWMKEFNPDPGAANGNYTPNVGGSFSITNNLGEPSLYLRTVYPAY